jgi:hypothetical protein
MSKQSIFALKQKSENIIRGKIQQYPNEYMEYNYDIFYTHSVSTPEEIVFHLEVNHPFGTVEAVDLFQSSLTSEEAETMKQYLIHIVNALSVLKICRKK